MNIFQPFGYEFRNPKLLTQAYTHKSYANENPDKCFGDNEVLEFLGDAVLDLSLAQSLMEQYPNFNEGELSKLRASLVNESFLSIMGKNLGIEGHLLLGKGEKQSGGSDKPRLIASGLEAIFGALFKDAGFEVAHQMIQKLFQSQTSRTDLTTFLNSDYKTRFQEKIQRELRLTPEYELIKEVGPDHDKIFYVQVKVDKRVISNGSGRSKKLAEQDAAKSGLEVSL